jgi:hypothetical protein
MATPQSIGALRIHHASANLCVGSLDGFTLMRTFGRATAEDLRAMLKAHRAALAHRPQGVGSMVIMDPATSIPEEGARRVAVELASKMTEQVAASATIVLGEGFWASAMRGVLTTTLLLAKFRQHPNRVFGDELEGLEWVITALNEPVELYRQPLLDALAQMRTAGAP